LWRKELIGMAKSILLMGRGPDGKAKKINVDENGNVKIQLSRNMVELLDSGAFYADGVGGKYTTVRYDLNEYNNVMLEIAAPYAIKVEIFVGENEKLTDEMIVNSGSYLIGTYSSVKFTLQPLGCQGETVYAIKGVR
jgi:hypothetical protein